MKSTLIQSAYSHRNEHYNSLRKMEPRSRKTNNSNKLRANTIDLPLKPGARYISYKGFETIHLMKKI